MPNKPSDEYTPIPEGYLQASPMPYLDFVDFVDAQPPTKSETWWFVDVEWDENPDSNLQVAFAQARRKLGFDHDTDVYFRSATSAAEHAKRILEVYSEKVGGTITSEILRQIREELGSTVNDRLTLEWRTVGESEFREITLFPSYVHLSRNFEVRAHGLKMESIVVDGKTYTHKAEAHSEWRAAGPAIFSLWVNNRRISLGD